MNAPSLPSPTGPFSQAHTIIEIEKFVQRIADHWWEQQKQLDCPMPRPGGFTWPEILRFMQELPRYLTVLVPDHDYAVPIQVFLKACGDAGLMSTIGYPATRYRYGLTCLTAPMLHDFDAFVWQISDAVSRGVLRDACRARREVQRQKRDRLADKIRQILASRCKTLVVRVDLAFRKECQDGLTIAEVYRLLELFRQEMGAGHACFDYLVGWVIDLEQGADGGGYHLHVAFFYKGSRRRKGYYIARQIGELWERVTGARGSYNNVHNQADHYEAMGTRGIGMIHRNNAKECNNCVKAITYLTEPAKCDQYLRMKPKGKRTFYASLVPHCEQDLPIIEVNQEVAA